MIITAALAKKYGFNAKETAFLKKLNEDLMSDAIYELEHSTISSVDEIIKRNMLERTLDYGDLLFEKLKFPFEFTGDYAGYSTLDELKQLIAKYEAKGITHIESEELCLVTVHELDEGELYLLKSAFKKVQDWHKEDREHYESRQAKQKIADAKKAIAAKRKEIIQLEKVLASG